MAVHMTCEVEFIGGPVDGQTDKLGRPLDPFLGIRSVTEADSLWAAAWRLLSGHRQASHSAVAVYELQQLDDGRQCYRYLGTHVISRSFLPVREKSCG